MIGAGTKAVHRNPNKLVAHATPSRSYMAGANRGKPAATKLRTNVFAASAEAAELR